MIGLDSQAHIWLCTEPTDMRKSFRVPLSASGQRALTLTDLQLLIDGIEMQKYRQFKRFRGV